MLHKPNERSYSSIAANLEKFKEMAKLVHMSQMVPGIKDADMAFMILMECEMTGQTIFEWDQENHIICGRPSMKYDAMIAAYHQLPNCRVKVLEKSPEKASVLLIDGEDETTFTLTWQDAQREPWVYEGKESDNVAILAKGETPPRMKAKYATPRSRAIMLYARCVSDAIRTTRPEVTKGRYTPEEIEDFDTVDAAEVREVDPPKLSDPKKLEAPKPKSAEALPAPAEAASPSPAAANPETAEASVIDQETPEPESLAGKLAVDMNGPCAAEQVERIKELLGSLKKDGQDFFGTVKATLAAHKIDGLKGLSYAEANLLIRGLEAKEVSEWVGTQLRGPVSPS